MAVRNRTIIRQEQTFAAGDAPITDNLPVNPLSYVDIVIRGLTLTTNTIPTLANMLAVLSRVEVLFHGSSIISITPADLYALGHGMGWLRNLPQPRSRTANERWRVLLRVSFSRVPFWLKEGFPASKAGELQIRYTPAAAFTNVVTTSLHVETEEILDAAFDHFLKYTTLSRTPTATGESDQVMPIGNPYAAILLFGTSVPTALLDTASMREVRLLIDNQEAYVPRTRWDDLSQTFQVVADATSWLVEHVHLENTAGVYTQNVATAGPLWDVHTLANYGWIEFDPLRDGAYLLPTVGRSEVKLRINADVADAQRIIPVELITTGAAGGGVRPA